MSNKTYDTLKIIAAVILPMLSAFVIGVGEIWGIEIMAPIGATLALADTVLGAALAKLSKDYHKEGETNDN